MLSRETRVLFRKERRQLLANRTAIATSMIPQVLLLFVLPHVMIAASRSANAAGPADHPPPVRLGFVGDMVMDPTRFPTYLLPLFIVIAGLTGPMMLAIHALVVERETRTLDLLIALPVRLSDVLVAKAAAVLALTFGLSAVFLTVVSSELLFLGIASPLEVLALFLELFAASAAGTVTALVIGFHAPDFRTAQNVSAAYILPALFIGVALTMLVGGGAWRPLTLAGFYGLWAAFLVAHAARQRSFEQVLK